MNINGEGIEVREKYFNKIKADDSLPIEWLSGAYRVLKDNTCIYIFCNWKKWSELEKAVQENKFTVKNMLVMNKSNHGMGDIKGSYAPKHELVLFAHKGKAKIWNGQEVRKNDVWDVPVKFSGSKHLHPNEKPLSWIEPMILTASKENQVVLDPFMGSGTTGVVSIKNNRHFIGIELDENYYKVAQERLNNDA